MNLIELNARLKEEQTIRTDLLEHAVDETLLKNDIVHYVEKYGLQKFVDFMHEIDEILAEF